MAANDDNIYYGIGIGSGIGTTDTATGGNGGNVQGGNGGIAVGPIAIGVGTVSAFGINTGINVPTDTGQKSNCETAGGTSSIGDKTPGSCTDTSTNGIIQSGGILTHGEKHK